MAPLSSTASLLRRLGDPDRPVPAVAAMLLASLLLLAAVLVALPAPAEGSDGPVVDVAPATGSSSLLEGPTRVVLPQPTGDRHEARILVNHRAADVTVSAELVNSTGLSVALAEAGPRSTAVVVGSEAVHVCGHYAGSLVLQASHPTLPSDVLVLDVRYAECSEHEAVALAPDTVNDVAPTWADDGRPPWMGVPTPVEPTETEGTEGTETASQAPTASEATARSRGERTTEPADEPTTEPTTEPTAAPTADPTTDPTTDPTAEPTPEPTSEPTEEPTSEPTTDPSPAPSPTSTDDATTTDGGTSPSPSESPTPTTGS